MRVDLRMHGLWMKRRERTRESSPPCDRPARLIRSLPSAKAKKKKLATLAPTNNMQKKKKRPFELCSLQHPKTVRSICGYFTDLTPLPQKDIFFSSFNFGLSGVDPRVCLTQWELIHHDSCRDRTPVRNLVNRVRQR